MSFDDIPNDLKLLKQWVVWRHEPTSNGKTTKVPYSAASGSLASVSDRSSMADYEKACSAVNGFYHGIGFVFTKDDDFSGIDLDASPDKQIVERQIRVFDAFDSYSEKSPSGKGLHIIVKGRVPTGRRKGAIEVYSEGRFFTMTGDVYHAKPIEERQELLDLLWREMGGAARVGIEMPTGQGERIGQIGQIGQGGQAVISGPEIYKDSEIIRMAIAAANGKKADKLLRGEWRNDYSSQSEADLALFNILAFYTQNSVQLIRMFRDSALGTRTKAQRDGYMQSLLNKALDKVLPPVDLANMSSGLSNAIAEYATDRRRQDSAAAEKEKYPTTTPMSESIYSFPPGILGDVASFIYEAAPRPVAEAALAGAIGFMSGICGLSYNVSRTGLNQYVLYLAESGMGKDAIASGINRLRYAFRASLPASSSFFGPSQIASGQALFKYIGRGNKCFVSILGEFGVRMQQLSSARASSAELALKAVLLDLYMKSGFGSVIDPSVYSQRENGVDMLPAASLSILAESTPGSFYQAVDETLVKDGLLPRFLIIEYTGKRQPLSLAAETAEPSSALIEAIGGLMEKCLRLIQSGAIINVEICPQAKEAADAFDVEADGKINDADGDIVRDLWNRAHLKLLKLSALVAVGINPSAPIIKLEHVVWAKAIIEYETYKLLSLFDSGAIGKSNDELYQLTEMRRVTREYMESGPEIVRKYDVPTEMWEARVIPYSFIMRRLITMSAYKNDRIGAAAAIKRTVQSLVDMGELEEISKAQMGINFKTYARAFMRPALI